MTNMNLDSLHCFIEFIDGTFDEGRSIVVEYYLNHNSEWRLIGRQQQSNKSVTESQANRSAIDVSKSIGSDVHGWTRKSIRDSNDQCTFNHLFELNFEFDKQFKQETMKNNSDQTDSNEKREYLKDKDDNQESTVDSDPNAKNETDRNLPKNRKQHLSLDWPYFEVRVWSFDEWKRKQFIGLAFFNLPEKAGSLIETLKIWSPSSSHPKTKLQQFFLGYAFEPTTRLTDKSDWRISLNGRMVGMLRVKLNLIICKRVPTHLESEELDVIEEKIQKIIVAFRDTRRRMQYLLKDKENVQFN